MTSEGTAVKENVGGGKEVLSWRRQCGCIRTSEKLKKILNSFPPPPPPTPLPNFEDIHELQNGRFQKCNSHYCNHPTWRDMAIPAVKRTDTFDDKKICSTTWQVVAEVVQLVQLSVTATTLALYYIIYCYMQLVYYTLRSAIYFHNADVPMKITIGVVTATSLVVGFNLLLRLERALGVLY